MLVPKSEIITRIRLIIDEIRMNESDFEEGQDEKDLDSLIEGFALEALRFVNLNAPHELLAADAKLSATDPNFKRESGVLPNTQIGVFYDVEKFLRLICVRCSAWKKPVFNAIMEGSASWEKLSNKYLTGTTEDPMVSVGKKATGLTVLDYSNAEIRLYSMPTDKANETVAEVYYMQTPEWSEEDKLRISYLISDAYHYYLAYLVLMSLGDSRAQIVLQQALPLLGLKESKDVGSD